MSLNPKSELEKQVIIRSRDYGINMTLFRNAIGTRLGVNTTDMECLGLLFFKGVSTPTELAQHTGLTSGATTALLDRLEQARFIIRQPNPTDRRGVLVTMSKAVKKRVGPLFASAQKRQDALMRGYTVDELMVLDDFFSRFSKMYDEERINITRKK